jgi:hypothetical protein
MIANTTEHPISTDSSSKITCMITSIIPIILWARAMLFRRWYDVLGIKQFFALLTPIGGGAAINLPYFQAITYRTGRNH